MAAPMFFSWRTAILKSPLAATTKLVLLTLSCHMNDAGECCYPSIATLCAESSLSNKSVIDHLQIAEAAGWIVVKKHGFAGQKWARNEYAMAWPKDAIAASPPCAKGGEGGSPPSVVNLVHKPVDKSDKGGEGGSPPYQKGGEPDGEKVVKEVHTNSSKNSSIPTYAREEVFPEPKPTPDLRVKFGMGIEWRPSAHFPSLARMAGVVVPRNDTQLGEFIAYWLRYPDLARTQQEWDHAYLKNLRVAKVQGEAASVEKRKRAMGAWWETDQATLSYGTQVGLQARPGESMNEYRARLRTQSVSARLSA